MNVLTIAIGSGFALLLAQAPENNARIKEKVRMSSIAIGTFEVKMLPPAGPPVEGDFVRLSLDKAFAGAMEGTSRVEMMASSDGSSPSGGYVALERFTGKLDGRAGGFVMQHSGVMSPGFMEIQVVITPGSGSGELAGISGKLEIRKEGKQHHYTLHYEVLRQE
jgi:hypothetical protein